MVSLSRNSLKWEMQNKIVSSKVGRKTVTILSYQMSFPPCLLNKNEHRDLSIKQSPAPEAIACNVKAVSDTIQKTNSKVEQHQI